MQNLSDLYFSNDPEELFEAAINRSIISNHISHKKKAAHDKLNADRDKFKFYIKDDVHDDYDDDNDVVGKLEKKKRSKVFNEFPDTTHIDAPPEVLYWYGMYHLQLYTKHRNGSRSKDYAKLLFKRASRIDDASPYPLAIYMLGWVSELEGRFDEAVGNILLPTYYFEFIYFFIKVK
jgi:hypothetical protein